VRGNKELEELFGVSYERLDILPEYQAVASIPISQLESDDEKADLTIVPTPYEQDNDGASSKNQYSTYGSTD
jgi:hypothetical protein